MKLTFLGAAGAVTGSCYLLQTSRATLLLECGQIQGSSTEEALNRLPLPVPWCSVDAIVLSHAHIDHSGRLPLAHREGYDGPIYTHDATRALCSVMLRDSAYLHEKDESGAIIIGGSGMCTGGRIRHHLKHNVWRPECHVLMIGFQAHGTLGRRLVDGAPRIRLWQETIRVNAQVHTVGGLSAHADQDGLLGWYGNFRGRPPVYLVHGEQKARLALTDKLGERYGVEARRPQLDEVVSLI